jgi:hypothetical protein
MTRTVSIAERRFAGHQGQPRAGPRLDDDVLTRSVPRSTGSRWPGSLPLVLVCLLVTSCGGASDETGATRNQEEAEAETPSADPRTVGTDPDYDCPQHGGMCLGPLDAGTYATQMFGPQIVYTVAAGWTNGEDLPGNFLLQREGDDRYLGIYRNVAAPDACHERPLRGVGRRVEDLVSWLVDHPGLETTDPEPASVGGLEGVYLELSLDPAWQTTCSYSQGQPVVPFIVGGGVSSLHHVILPGFEERLYLLEHAGGNVAIEVGPEGQDLDQYLEEVMPIIQTLEFGD